MKRILAMVAVGIVLGLNGAFAAELQIWTVEEPPASFVDAQDELRGYAVDIVRAIQERLGNSEPILVAPEARVYELALKEPNLIIFAFSRTAEREQSFHWISLIMRKSWVLYAVKGAGLRIRNMEEARGVDLIGVVRGDVRSAWLKDQGFTNLDESSQHEQNVRKLLSGRVQLIFFESQGLAYACKKLGIETEHFAPVFTPKISEVYIAISKPGTSPETVRVWQEAAGRLKAEGVFQRIGERWLQTLRRQGCRQCEVRDGILTY